MFGIDFNIGGEERAIANTIKARYDAGVTNFRQDSKTRRGRIGGAVAQTLDTSCNQGVIETIKGNIPNDHPGQYVEIYPGTIVYAVWYEKYQCYIAIRKLTPRECFRLQGWTDDYFEKAQFVNSDSQLYKQAGNGVTVNVVEVIGQSMKGD